MNPPVIVRRNRLFVIDKNVIPEGAETPEISGALYAAVHDEFKGAAYSEGYKHLSIQDRIDSLNKFAWQWLEDRGFKYEG